MSATIEVPRGLDKLSPEEERLMESMRDDGPDLPEAEPAAAPPAPVAEDLEIDVPDEPEPAAGARPTTVPHAQFHAANERRKAAELKTREAEARAAAAEAAADKERAVTQARLDMLARIAETSAPAVAAPVADPAPVEEALPDRNVDPIGYFEALTTRQAKQVESLTGMVRGLTEGQRQQQQLAELRQWGIQQETAFKQTNPDFDDAMTHMRRTRDEELKAIGVNDAAERQRIMNNDVTAIALRARQEGGNFAERLYGTALARGYAKKVADPAPAAAAPAAAAPVASNGVAIPPLEVEPPAAPSARAARIEQGRENSTTIGSLGSAPPAKLSVEKIANMSESDFAVFIKRYEGNPAALRDLMGH